MRTRSTQWAISAAKSRCKKCNAPNPTANNPKPFTILNIAIASIQRLSSRGFRVEAMGSENSIMAEKEDCTTGPWLGLPFKSPCDRTGAEGLGSTNTGEDARAGERKGLL